MKKQIFCYLVSIILLIGLASAGFGSSYVPEINGEKVIQIPIGTSSDYFIYPQNFDNTILLVKVNILNGSEVLANTLQESYEVPVNTSSDEFPIELTFRLENNSELIGKEYFVSYEILSTFKQENETGIVTFSPVGYKKSFYVEGIEYVPEPVNNTPTPTPAPSTITSSGGGGGGSSQTTAITKKSTPQPVQTPTPAKTETPIEPEKPVIIENSVIPTKTFWDIVKSIKWIYVVFTLVIICIIGIIGFAIRNRNKDRLDDYNYNYQEDIR